MAKTAVLNIRIDPVVKEKAEKLFNAFGISTTDAINMFLSKSIMVGGLPFNVRMPNYNAETISAMIEAKKISQDPNAKSFDNVEEFFKDLDS
jgi:DNA-damage-inducible protein J